MFKISLVCGGIDLLNIIMDNNNNWSISGSK